MLACTACQALSRPSFRLYFGTLSLDLILTFPTRIVFIRAEDTEVSTYNVLVKKTVGLYTL